MGTRLNRFETKRAVNWNQSHARPIKMGHTKGQTVKLAGREHTQTSRQLFHGSATKRDILKPHEGNTSRVMPDVKKELFASNKRLIGEHYALGGYGKGLQSQLTNGGKVHSREVGYVHTLSKASNKHFTSGSSQIGHNKALGAQLKTIRGGRRGGGSGRARAALFGSPKAHLFRENAFAAKGQYKPTGGYWVHQHPETHQVSRFLNKPRTGSEQLKHDVIKAGGVAAGAAAVGYGGYKAYQHRGEIKEKAHQMGSNVHNAFHSTHQAFGHRG